MFTIIDSKNEILVKDSTGEKISSSDSEFLKWLREGNTPNPEKYDHAKLRKKEYPAIEEQLDMIYHNIEGWKAQIKAVKDAYPKGQQDYPIPEWVDRCRIPQEPPKLP